MAADEVIVVSVEVGGVYSPRPGAWRSLVARCNGVAEVERSNRSAPTVKVKAGVAQSTDVADGLPGQPAYRTSNDSCGIRMARGQYVENQGVSLGLHRNRATEFFSLPAIAASSWAVA